MAYSDIDKPSEYFDTATYAGSESSQDITSLNFQPDWVWIKNRSSTPSHQLTDVVRGVHNVIYSNLTNVENVSVSQGVGAFLSNGFQVDGNIGGVNDGGSNFVAWNWLAGGTASSNTDGSITSQVSANTTSGFSIVSYTGNTTLGATVGHGLNTAPDMIIVKARNASGQSWVVGHSGIGWGKHLLLSGTQAESTATNTSFNGTAPTSTVFSLGNDTQVNESPYNYIAYCFAEKKGFSKFGSYTGNGSTDGTFVYTGFKPAWVMIKQSSAAGESWYTFDAVRNTFNPLDKGLVSNQNIEEFTFDPWDFTSNGFKARKNWSGNNSSGTTYIYMAFAENPLVTSTGIPTTAR